MTKFFYHAVLTSGSSDHECKLKADVAWPVLIGLQLQEPTNTARPTLENDTYAGNLSPAPIPANDCRWGTLA